MGSFSVWHWLIVLIVFVVPIIFIVKSPPTGPNRFGEIPPSMNFGEAIASFFRNYVNFADRASRSEFWFAMLFTFVITVILNIVDPTEVLSGIFALAVLLPTLAVGARRLHDINRSGWFQLLSWLFPIGTIAVIVWWCQRASDGAASATYVVASKPTTMASVEVLEKLAKLKDSGAISQEEFEAEKRKLLRMESGAISHAARDS